MAPRHDTDLFVSIYFNHLSSEFIDAAETYHFGRYPDERAPEPAQRGNNASDNPPSVFEGLMKSMHDACESQ